MCFELLIKHPRRGPTDTNPGRRAEEWPQYTRHKQITRGYIQESVTETRGKAEAPL